MSEQGTPVSSNEELRSDIELIFRVYRDLARESEQHLKNHQLGRLHHQLLLCISRRPEMPVSHHLSIMKLTKQSISRLIRDLLDRGLVEERTGMHDRRKRFLHATPMGAELERQLTEAQAKRFARLHDLTDPEGLECFRRMMCALLDPASLVDIKRNIAELEGYPSNVNVLDRGNPG
jgi:DNA-binding MarR family transcriptional regulator